MQTKRVLSNRLVKELFFSGQYATLLEQFDHDECPVEDDTVHFFIGALCQQGRMFDANVLFRDKKQNLQFTQLIASRFFLGVGYVRGSQYDEGLKHFIENLRLRPKTEDATALFLIFQGLGFYHYFCGHYEKSLKSAEKAAAYAQNTKNTFFRTLALDLLGHAKVQRGDVASGLDYLDRAVKLNNSDAESLLAKGIHFAAMTYRAQHGMLSAGEHVVNLRQAIHAMRPQETFSRSGAMLELGRQLTLIGDLTEAEYVLEQAATLIHSAQNRRQTAALAMRLAFLRFRRGYPSHALTLLRGAHRDLNPRVDYALKCQLLGFEARILDQIGQIAESQELQKQVVALTQKTCSSVSINILRRQKILDPQIKNQFDDRLGRLMDLIGENDPSVPRVVMKAGYYGLLYEALRIPFERPTIVFDIPSGKATFMDLGQVSVAEERLTPQIRSLITSLCHSPKTKEHLIENIWGYAKPKQHHDVLLQQAFWRLRQFLGERAGWFQRKGHHYLLNATVTKYGELERDVVNPARHESAPMIEIGVSPRHEQIIRRSKVGDYVDATSCARHFGVSEMTARRDLNFLADHGFFRRIGKTRATTYQRISNLLSKGDLSDEI